MLSSYSSTDGLSLRLTAQLNPSDLTILPASEDAAYTDGAEHALPATALPNDALITWAVLVVGAVYFGGMLRLARRDALEAQYLPPWWLTLLFLPLRILHPLAARLVLLPLRGLLAGASAYIWRHVLRAPAERVAGVVRACCPPARAPTPRVHPEPPGIPRPASPPTPSGLVRVCLYRDMCI